MTLATIAAVSAGLGQPSSTRLLTDRLSTAVEQRLAEADRPAVVQTIELRPLAHEIADALVTGFPSPALREALETVTGADGLIAATPILNASYAGLFKSFFDLFDADALVDMPVLLGATGGTPRHSLAVDHALRPLFAYLRAQVAPTGVYAATADWGGASGIASIQERVDRAAREFARLVAGTPVVRTAETVMPFEQQLEAVRSGRPLSR